jgi:hypothetical protein
MSYGPDQIAQWRGAATYGRSHSAGREAAELPVQAPAKYELVINHQDRQGDRIEHPTSLAGSVPTRWIE